MLKRIIAIVLLLTIVMPLPTLAANDSGETGSIVAAIGGNATLSLLDNGNNIAVNNGDLIVLFYKDYDVVSSSNGDIQIYNNRFNLEYQAGQQWRQRGLPISVTYSGDNINGYTVTRHYDDYISTTFDVSYLIRVNQPIKITITINNGQASNYRFVWSASGIVGNYVESVNRLDFSGVILDWNDAFQFTSNYVLTNVAQGRKADITFTLGNISAGQQVVIDPSIVSSTTGNSTMGRTEARRTVYASGRHWVFYSDGTNYNYRSSTDGATWSGATSIGAGSHITLSPLSIFYDGTYIHYARYNDSAGNMYYRRGELESDGTITWSAAEQSWAVGAIFYINICVNSEGYPFIAYYLQSDSKCYVTKSSTNDGTWATDAGFPYAMSATTGFSTYAIVPLTDGNVYCIYQKSGDDVRGRKWTDSTTTWEAEDTVCTTHSNGAGFAVTAYNGTIYCVYLDNTGKVQYVEYSAGWGAKVEIRSTADTAAYCAIGLFRTSGDLKAFYVDNAADKIYYKSRISGTWDANWTLWIDESATGLNGLVASSNFNCAYQCLGGVLGLIYLGGSAGSYKIKYDFLQDVSAPSVINTAADNITETTARLNGEITNTGGVNATVRGFEWDTDSGAPYANDWHEHGNFGAATFNHEITGLSPDTTFYWRAYATNTEGTTYSAERNSDTLLPFPLPPDNMVITQSDLGEITLTWDAGLYADTTIIRIKEDSYPTDIADGYELYNGALETATYGGLNLSMNTYYIRAWSNNARGNSLTTTDKTYGGSGMVGLSIGLFGLIGLASLTIGFVVKKGIFGGIAAIFFLAMAFTAFINSSQNWAAWDTNLMLFFAGLFLVLVSLLGIAGMHEKAQTLAEVLNPNETEQYWRERDEMAQAFNIFSRPNRKPKPPPIDV